MSRAAEHRMLPALLLAIPLVAAAAQTNPAPRKPPDRNAFTIPTPWVPQMEEFSLDTLIALLAPRTSSAKEK